MAEEYISPKAKNVLHVDLPNQPFSKLAYTLLMFEQSSDFLYLHSEKNIVHVAESFLSEYGHARLTRSSNQHFRTICAFSVVLQQAVHSEQKLKTT